jgi:hypothetical protein
MAFFWLEWYPDLRRILESRPSLRWNPCLHPFRRVRAILCKSQKLLGQAQVTTQRIEKHRSFHTYFLGVGFINPWASPLRELLNKAVVWNPLEWIMPKLTMHPTRERVA